MFCNAKIPWHDDQIRCVFVTKNRSHQQEFKMSIEDESNNLKVVMASGKELTDYCKTLPIKIETTPVENEVRDSINRYERLKMVNLDAEREAKVLEQNVEIYQNAIDPVKDTLDDLDAFLDLEIGLDVEKSKDELQRVEVGSPFTGDGRYAFIYTTTPLNSSLYSRPISLQHVVLVMWV